MTKKPKQSKLSITRETLKKLDSKSLDNVQGATGVRTCYCYVRPHWTSGCY